MLYTYATVVAVLLIAELVVAGLVFGYRGKLEETLKTNFNNLIVSYKDDPAAKAAIDTIQSTFSCCGATSSEDWTGQDLPDSCCPVSDTHRKCERPHVFENACVTEVNKLMGTVLNAVGIVGIILALIYAVAIVSSCIVGKSYRRDYNTV